MASSKGSSQRCKREELLVCNMLTTHSSPSKMTLIIKPGILNTCSCFEQLSGLAINYDKCNLLTLGMIEEESNHFSRLFCYAIGSFPIKYLGVPLHFTRLRREDIQPVVDKLVKRIAVWKGKLLSSAGKLTLLKSCLASIPTYLLSTSFLLLSFLSGPLRILTLIWPISFGMMLMVNIKALIKLA